MKKIAAVVVTYNRKEMLKECLNSLLRLKKDGLEIFVVDNASTDGTYEEIEPLIIKSKPGELRYFNTQKNLGGAGGFNYGLREVLKGDYDYAWLMDDDTIVQKNTLDSLLDKAKLLKDDFSFLSSLAKWTDGSFCEMNRQLIDPDWFKHEDHFKDGLAPITHATFVSYFVNMPVVKRAGLPIKEFFIYGDDWEYSLRLSKIKPGYMVFDSEVLHKMPSNKPANLISCSADRISRYYYDHRNQNYIMRKYLSTKKKVEFWTVRWPYHVIQILRKSPDHKWKRIWTLTKGEFVGKFFSPKVEMG